MNGSTIARKLAVMVTADVVGFSRRMDGNDTGTLARLKEIREHLFNPKIA